jgi:photosystem II stability/assembly factor-like uncharacterized protein
MTTRRPSPIVLLLIACFAVSLLGNPAQAQTEGFTENFDDGLAQGWDLEPGWQVVTERGQGYLEGEGHVWARPGVEFEGDFRLTFRIRLLSGRIHLVYRLNDIGRYFIGFESDGSDLNRQEWPDTFHNGLVSAAIGHSLNAWHEIEITGQGDLLRFAVDGRNEWEYVDPSPLVGGSFAFETLDGGAAQIDDIVVYTEASPPSTPAAVDLGDLTWVRTGGPLGGLGYDVRMQLDDPDHMWVTDAFAGAFLSFNAGQTWAPSNEGIITRAGPSGDAIPVFCLTVDPHNPSIVWAGTQFQRGIFRSTDGGRTWEKRDNGITERDGITFRGLTVDPRSSDIVYAAAEISSWADGARERPGREFDMTRGVVYRTEDAGLHWRAVWRGDNLARYVWVNPDNPDVIYISTGIFDREAYNSDPVAGTPGGEGIVRSTDGGHTWAPANSGLGNLYVGSLFMHPQNPKILLAGTGNNQYYGSAGAYLSTDGGDSWQYVLRGGSIEAVEFALSNPDIAYAASNSAVYRSEDGGQSWEQMAGGVNGWGPPGVRAGFPIDLQVDPRDPDRIFANAYGGGNFLSTDGGRTWTVASTGYTGAQVRAIALDPSEPARIFAAARSGIFLSQDAGATWIGRSFPPAVSLEWTAVAIDPVNPDHLLAATNWDRLLLESTDSGQSWRIVETAPDPRTGWRAIAYAPSDPTVVYAGTAGFYSAGSFDPSMPGAGIFRSNDGGATWEQINDGLSADAHVTALAIDPHDSQEVYAATVNHGLLHTADGGRSWIAVNSGLPGSPPPAFSVALHPTPADTLFVGLCRGAVYRSTDGAETWRSSAAGLPPEACIVSLLIDPNQPEVMYAADVGSGVYRSVDGGSSWTLLNNGLRTRAVNALALSLDGQHLYAATEGEGVFRLDLNGTPPEPAADLAPVATPTTVVPSPGAPVAPTQPPTMPAPVPAARVAVNWLYVGLGAGAIALVAFTVVLTRRRRS